MAISNLMLMESIENTTVKPDQIYKDIKKLLQTCRLTKYTSADKCAEFYTVFFMQTLQEPVRLTIDEWSIVYNKLMCDNVFIENLSLYIAIYHPLEYRGMFQSLYNEFLSEFTQMKTRRIAFAGTVKALFSMLEMKFDEIRVILAANQIKSQDSIKFQTVIDQTLRSYQVSIQNIIQEELDHTAKDDIATIPTTATLNREDVPLEEDVRELFALMENHQQWIDTYIINEGIVSNAKEKAKEIAQGIKKAERAFDELVMKKFNELKVERRNRKHSEMVGESLRISHEIKRLLKSGAISIFSPTIGVLHWIVTFFIDKVTDKRDKEVLVADIKDEIEIIDEKIQMAERNGDDKAKIDLIRFRQKLYREYERINRVRFDRSRMQRSI